MKCFCSPLHTSLLRFEHVIEFSTGPKGIKLFSSSTQLNTKLQLLIETKMLKNKDFSCFQTFRCCIYRANKC